MPVVQYLNSSLSTRSAYALVHADSRARVDSPARRATSPIRELNAIGRAPWPSVPRGVAARQHLGEEQFFAMLGDQSRERFIGPVLNGLYRQVRDQYRYWNGQSPIPAMSRSGRGLAPSDGAAPGMGTRTRGRQAVSEAPERLAVERTVTAREVEKGISIGRLKGSSSDARSFAVALPAGKRLLSVTTSCGRGRADVLVTTPDGSVVQRCEWNHPSRQTVAACLIDRQDLGEAGLDRLLVTVGGVRGTFEGVRLNLKALEDPGDYGMNSAPGRKAAEVNQDKCVIEPSAFARSAQCAPNLVVAGPPSICVSLPSGSLQPVLLNRSLKLVPGAPVHVPATLVARGVRAENLASEVFGAYHFTLELPVDKNWLHVFASCSQSPYVLVRVFANNKLLSQGGPFGPHHASNNVAVVNLERARAAGLGEVDVEVNALGNFAGLNFNARAV